MEEQHEKEDLQKKLGEIAAESSEYRKQFESDWNEQTKFYYGDHWKYAKARPVKNWCFMIVEGEIPILTDSRPAVDIIPYDAEDFDRAKVLESAMHYIYDKEQLSLKLPEIVRSALISGTGYFYVYWDEDAENGQGNVKIKILDNKMVYFDPAANNVEDGNYVRIVMPIAIEDLKRKYPEFADEFKPIRYDSQVIQGYVAEDGTPQTQWNGFGQGVDPSQKSRYSASNMSVVEEYWLRDYSTRRVTEEETIAEISKEADQITRLINPDVGKYEDHKLHIESHRELKYSIASEALGINLAEVTDKDIERLKEDPQIGLVFNIIDDHLEMHEMLLPENPNAQKPKYMNNRRLVVKSGDVICYDGDVPVDDGMLCPVVPVYCYKTSDSPYGMGEIKNIISAQKSFNEMDYSELQGLRLTGNPGWVYDIESGVNPDTLTNEQGLVVPKKTGTEVRRLEPGMINSQLTTRKQMDQQAMEAISGVSEATQGRRPTGITAASAIRYLQEQSIGRIRLKTRYLEEYSMLRLGWLVTKRIIKYWSNERKLRIYDNNGEIKYVDYNPDQMINLNYEMKMVPGSTAGLDKESIFTTLKELVQAQIITPQTFFSVVDIPYRNKIIKDLQDRDEQLALMEQIQAENEQLKAQLQGGNQVPQEMVPGQDVQQL